MPAMSKSDKTTQAPAAGSASEFKPATKLVTGGRAPFESHGFVNPPVYHASTVLYRTAADFLAHRNRYQYGRRGTPTSEALERARIAPESR